jgi:PAS domain S-box-containing protein
MHKQKQIYDLFENFTTGIVVHGSNTEVLFANQPALNILGLTMEQMEGKLATDPRWRFIREDGTLLPFEEFPVNQVQFTNKAIKNLIIGVLRPDLDNPNWVICNAHPEFEQDKKISQIIVNFTDITERKRTEIELKIERDRSKQYLNIVETILVALDEKANIILLNRKGYQVLGYDQGELEGQNWFKTCVPPEESEAIFLAYTKIIEGEVGTFEYFENYILTKQGGRRLIAWHNSAFKDESGKIIRTLSSGEDITLRRQTENELKETAEKLNKTYSLARIGVWSWIVATDTATWSNELYHIAGLDPKLPPPSFTEMAKLHSPESWVRLQAAVEKAVASGTPYQLELEYIIPDGTSRNVTVYGGVKHDASGKVIELYGTVQDFTDEKRAKIELKTALENAKKAALIKSHFLDIAAHELRTPVSAFSLLLQLTQKKLEMGTPVDLNILTRLRSQVDRISQLVVELLDVSRLERGALILKPTLTNLNLMISQCIEEFKLRAPNRSLIFFKPDRQIEITIDSLRIFQVLSNLIDNAFKYTPDNSSIEISLEEKPGLARVTVKDYGQGIPDKDQAELFSLFSRGPTDLTEQVGGLGLGLYISREIIELHGGTIGVTSETGVGSTFYFELPKG